MMFPDLTQINVPYGLLDPETQEALKAHDGPYQAYFFMKGWTDWECPNWDNHITYRVNPAHPQPRTIYLCEFRDGERSFHKTAIDATEEALSYGPGATVSEWREVVE